jgi:putative Ca2+/H+ antiporter (TMEM165/GDT1 family)
MDLGVGASAFALLFVAEMGDKTQLTAMTLATRYRALPVAIGVCSAFLVLNVLAVLVGQVLFRYVPKQAVLLAAGMLFLVFAWKSWQASDEDEEASGPADARSAVITSFLMIFMAELGDKTQLALIALAASSGAVWSVFAGATLALWAVSLIGIFVGATLLKNVPKALMHRAAALLFAGFGLLALWRAAAGTV